MAEITRFSGCTDWLELDFVERERTPSELMKLGIRYHLSGLSLTNTVRELEIFGVKRSRKAVHDWVQKADLQPASDANSDHIVLDETMIHDNLQMLRKSFTSALSRRSQKIVEINHYPNERILRLQLYGGW